MRLSEKAPLVLCEEMLRFQISKNVTESRNKPGFLQIKLISRDIYIPAPIK
jgi:hypothetical protein